MIYYVPAVGVFEEFSDYIDRVPKTDDLIIHLFGMNNGSEYLTKLFVYSDRSPKIQFGSGAIYEGSFELIKSKIVESVKIIPRIIFRYKWNGQEVTVVVDLVPDAMTNNGKWVGSAASLWYLDGVFVREDRHSFNSYRLLE